MERLCEDDHMFMLVLPLKEKTGDQDALVASGDRAATILKPNKQVQIKWKQQLLR